MTSVPERPKASRDLAVGRASTSETVEGHLRLEKQRLAQGKTPWFSFDDNLSEKQLEWIQKSFPKAYNDFLTLVEKVKNDGKTPLFVSLASAAASGIPGTKSISINLTPGQKPLDESHIVLDGDLTTTKARNTLLQNTDTANSQLVFVEFSSPVPAMEYENDDYAKAKFHTLIRGLCERLVPGGFIYLVLRDRKELENELSILFNETSMQRIREGQAPMEYLYKKVV